MTASAAAVPHRWKQTVAAITPLVLLAALYVSLPFAISGGSLARTWSWLALAMCVLALIGWWILRACAMPAATRSSGAIALATIFIGWVWQRVAYLVLIPERFLTYGYFLKPPGDEARFFLVELPFVGVSVILVTCLVTALLFAWRAGARWSTMALVLWWLTAFVIFGLPTLYLVAQGDAAVFV
jgi:hypothetical protein